MNNKNILSKVTSELNKTKSLSKPRDIIYDPMGQWKYPGQPTMDGVPYPVMAYPNIGEPELMYPGQDYNFPEADYVDEYPELRKGGLVRMPKPSKKGLSSKAYSRSLDATNRLYTENNLFKKPKSRRNKVFDPNAKYYQDGGEYVELELTPEEIEEYAKGGYIIEDISVPELTQAQNGGEKDKWGRSKGSKWYGFNPQTKQYEVKLKKPNPAVYKNNYSYPTPEVADNTRTVIPKEAVAAIENAAYMNSDEYKAAQKAKKQAQADFEKKQWAKYNKMSFGEKVLDRAGAVISEPLLMASNTLMGEQAYIPGMAAGLTPENPEYDNYLKATGQTRGLSVNDVFSAVNPGKWGSHAGREYGKGNIAQGLGELGLGIAGTVIGGPMVTGKGAVKTLNKADELVQNSYKLNPKQLPGSPNSLVTPEGFQNRVFDSNIQLGSFQGKGHLSEKGYTYRTLGNEEIEAIRNTQGVFPKAGKAKGGNENVKYWTKGNEKNWYAENPNQQVIRVKENKFNKDKVVSADDVEVYNHEVDAFEPIISKSENKSFMSKVKDYFDRPPGPLMLSMSKGAVFNKEIKNPDYFLELMKINTYSPKNKKYFEDLIATVKKQGNVASEKQYDELQRLKTGDINYGKKGYARGGIVSELSKKEIDDLVAQGYVVEEVD